MSLSTLKADVRYQDACRALNSRHLELNIADPAFDRVVDKRAALVDLMTRLAIEHHWDPEAQRWTDD